MLPSLIRSGPEEENINNFQEALNHLDLNRKRKQDKINQAKSEIEEFKSRIEKCQSEQQSLSAKIEEMKSKIDLYSSLTTKLEEMMKKSELNEKFAEKNLQSLEQYALNIESELNEKLSKKKEFIVESQARVNQHLIDYANSAAKKETFELVMQLKETDQKLSEQKKILDMSGENKADKVRKDWDTYVKLIVKIAESYKRLRETKLQRVKLEEDIEKRKKQKEQEQMAQLMQAPKHAMFKMPTLPTPPAYPTTTSSITLTKLQKSASIRRFDTELLSPFIRNRTAQQNDQPRVEQSESRVELSETISELDTNSYKEVSINQTSFYKPQFQQEAIHQIEDEETLNMSQNSIVQKSIVLKPNRFFNKRLNQRESDYNITMTVQMSNNNSSELPMGNNLTQEVFAQNTNNMLNFVDSLNKFTTTRTAETNSNYSHLFPF